MFDTEGSRVPLFKNNSKMAAGSRKFSEIPGSILSLFQGNMLYLINMSNCRRVLRLQMRFWNSEPMFSGIFLHEILSQ